MENSDKKLAQAKFEIKLSMLIAGTILSGICLLLLTTCSPAYA